MEIEHRDKLGRLLKIGDTIAYPYSNSLIIGSVKKITNKMILVVELGKPSSYYSTRKYPSDVVLLDGPEVTMYTLKLSV